MRVLVLTQRLPHRPDRGDRIRSHHLLKFLGARMQTSLFSFVHDEIEEASSACLEGVVSAVRTARVRRIVPRIQCLLALPTRRPLTHVLLAAREARGCLERLVAESPPDVVLAVGTGMGRLALESPLAAFPLVLDMVDVDSLKWRALARRTRAPMGWIYSREAATLARFERESAQAARATLVVNAREARDLGRLAPRAAVEVVPNGIDVEAFRPPGPPAKEPRVVFSGVFDYAPNEDAALWLAGEIWPRVRLECPGARLVLVGARPTRRLLRVASRDASIEVTGTVPRVAPHLWRCAVAVAPMRIARGVQNKVLEAIAAGLPAVVTSQVFEGLPEAARDSCAVADSAEAIARSLSRWLAAHPAERRRFAERSSLAEVSWERSLASLPAILARAIGAEDRTRYALEARAPS